MLIDIVNDSKYASIMQKNIQDILIFLFEKEQNFGILCKIEELSFNPPLPKEINDAFRPMTLFFLAGYTFESAQINDDYLEFEAGFGSENIGSFVSVPLLSIMQIIIDETPVFINLAQAKAEDEKESKEVKPEGIKNSMSAFLSNPENQKFIKKEPKR
jgi:hypothetical protein